MSDEKRENLTPAEQRTLDRAQVTIQIAQTDISEAVRKGVPFGARPPVVPLSRDPSSTP